MMKMVGKKMIKREEEEKNVMENLKKLFMMRGVQVVKGGGVDSICCHKPNRRTNSGGERKL